MNLTRSAGWLAGAMGCLALAGCLGAEDGAADDAINTTPASLAEANAEMDKLERIMAQGGSTPALLEQQRLISDRIDAFSGLVDRIEISPDHSINFFVSPDGELLVDERAKVGAKSVIKSNSFKSVEEIYRGLAPGRAVPAALAGAPAIQAGDLTTGPSASGVLPTSAQAPAAPVAADGTAVVQSALTDSPADNNWFIQNQCFIDHGGSLVFEQCIIGSGSNRFAQATSDHVQVSAAHTRGTGSFFIRRRPSEFGTIEREVRVLPGGEHWLWWVGGWVDVRDAGCLPWPFACGTHREATKKFKRWAIEGISSSKYDWSITFYNKPLVWNGP